MILWFWPSTYVICLETYNPRSMIFLQHHTKSCHQQGNGMRWFTSSVQNWSAESQLICLTQGLHWSNDFPRGKSELIWAGRMGWENKGVSTSQRSGRERLLLKAYFASLLKTLLGDRGKIKTDNSVSLGGGYFERLILPAAAQWHDEVTSLWSSEVWLLWLFLRTVTPLKVTIRAGASQWTWFEMWDKGNRIWITNCQVASRYARWEWVAVAREHKLRSPVGKTLGLGSKLETIIADLSSLINDYADYTSQTRPLIPLYLNFS